MDDTLGNGDLFGLAYSMRGVRPDDVEFFTAPVLGTGMEGPASVVYLDQAPGSGCGRTCATTRWPQNAAEFGDQQLPDVPR